MTIFARSSRKHPSLLLAGLRYQASNSLQNPPKPLSQLPCQALIFLPLGLLGFVFAHSLIL